MESYELGLIDAVEDIKEEIAEEEETVSDTDEGKVLCEFVITEEEDKVISAYTVTEIEPEPEVQKVEKAPVDASTFREGEIVYFKGGKVFGNATTTIAKKEDFPACAVKVIAKYRKGRHPYMVSHVDDTTSIYGWVDCVNLEEIE
jgi:hypothetical protein